MFPMVYQPWHKSATESEIESNFLIFLPTLILSVNTIESLVLHYLGSNSKSQGGCCMFTRKCRLKKIFTILTKERHECIFEILGSLHIFSFKCMHTYKTGQLHSS